MTKNQMGMVLSLSPAEPKESGRLQQLRHYRLILKITRVLRIASTPKIQSYQLSPLLIYDRDRDLVDCVTYGRCPTAQQNDRGHDP